MGNPSFITSLEEHTRKLGAKAPWRTSCRQEKPLSVTSQFGGLCLNWRREIDRRVRRGAWRHDLFHSQPQGEIIIIFVPPSLFSVVIIDLCKQEIHLQTPLSMQVAANHFEDYSCGMF
jgi:hypothetical protein